MRGLEGKAVLVTGAGSGIGAACVRRLLEEGALVAAADLNRSGVEEVISGLGDSDRVYGAQLDVTNRDQVAAFVSEARRRFGRLHGLINCAGIRGIGNVLDTDVESWRQVMSVNLDGTFNVCQAFARAAADDVHEGESASRGIVNVASTAGVMGLANRLSYVASKFGVSGITRTMASELAPYKIRVNAVAPGTVHTALTAYLFQDPESASRVRASHPIGREGRPEEIAAVIVFLLCDDASFVTGAVIPVDGGSVACLPSHSPKASPQVN